LVVALDKAIYSEFSGKTKNKYYAEFSRFIELEFIFINNTILIIATYFVSTFRGKFANFTFYP
jgi:hypothetical protein